MSWTPEQLKMAEPLILEDVRAGWLKIKRECGIDETICKEAADIEKWLHYGYQLGYADGAKCISKIKSQLEAMT